MSASYWSQAAVLVEYIARAEKDLKGKKIAIVYIDTPFGREPLPMLQELAKRAAESNGKIEVKPLRPLGNESLATPQTEC